MLILRLAARVLLGGLIVSAAGLAFAQDYPAKTIRIVTSPVGGTAAFVARAFSRETADHSLPYIVAAAVLDGAITVASFSPKMVLRADRQAFIKKVTCTPALELGSHAMGKHKRVEMGYLSRVEIELNDGTVVDGAARPFPGHHKNPFSDTDLNDKLRENVEPVAGAQRAERLIECLWTIDKAKSTREFTKLLAFGGKIDIDSARVREK